MSQLTKLRLDNGSIIYIETDRTDRPSANSSDLTDREQTREDLGKSSKMFGGFTDTFTQASRSTSTQTSSTTDTDSDTDQPTIRDTIRNYTDYVVQSVKDLSYAKVTAIKLEFGLELSGEAGIPYITKGAAKSNLKVTIECDLKGMDSGDNTATDDTEAGGEDGDDGSQTDETDNTNLNAIE
jgi:hypothetical protein